jgi:hypothetical protein
MNDMTTYLDLFKSGGVTYLNKGEDVNRIYPFEYKRTEQDELNDRIRFQMASESRGFPMIIPQNITNEDCLICGQPYNYYGWGQIDERFCNCCLDRIEKRKTKTVKPLSQSYEKRKVKDFLGG